MGTPMAFTSGTTNGFSVGATKRATTALNPAPTLVAGNNWFNGVDVSETQYLIYSDIFSQGQSTIPNSKPTAWTTPDLTDASLLALINTLPDRVGQIPYSDINVALQWLQNSEKYFLIKKGYEDIVTDGLVLNVDAGWYNSYPGSGTVWNDLTGENNDGSLFNGVSFSSEGLGSLLFDGADDYGQFTNTASIRPPTEMTICMWIKAQTITGTWKKILGQDPYTGGYLVFLESNGLDIRALHYVNGTEYRCNTTRQISTSEWTHVAFTFKTGDAIRSYFNGIQGNGTEILPAGTFTYNTSNPFLFGTLGGGYYNGYISCIQIYNRALSADEIFQNYNTQKTRFGFGGQSLFSGVTQYLDFSKQSSYPGSGTLVTDITGNGNDATFNNGSFTTFNGVKCFNATSANSWLVSDPVTLGSNYTIFIWANMLAESQVVSWRTLVRSGIPGEDHELIVQYGTNLLGYYDNENATGFNSYGINVANAGLENNWILYTLVGENATSQKVYINDGTTNASLNRNASGQQIVGIGNYQFGSQEFGYVANYILYNNQAFTQSQVNQYFQSTKQYYGYAPNNTISYGLTLSLDAGNPLSYPTTGTIWSNLVGNGNNLTLVNGPTFSSSNGGSIFFDGADDVAVLYGNPLITGTGDFTICSWVKRSSTNAAANFIAGNYGVGNNGLELYYYQNKLLFYSTNVYITSNVSINDTNWHFVSVTRSSGTGIIYFDGSFDISGSINVNIPGNNPFTIGNGFDYTSEAFFGNIAVCQVYNRALSSQEISNNFNAQRATFGL
jgi:hypothetical protein